MAISIFIFLKTFLLYLILDVVEVHCQCYFPGGDLAANYSPCDEYAYNSLCCLSGWACLSNNLCVVTASSPRDVGFPIGTSIRGTCENPEWNATACGDFCLGMKGLHELPLLLCLLQIVTTETLSSSLTGP